MCALWVFGIFFFLLGDSLFFAHRRTHHGAFLVLRISKSLHVNIYTYRYRYHSTTTVCSAPNLIEDNCTLLSQTAILITLRFLYHNGRSLKYFVWNGLTETQAITTIIRANTKMPSSFSLHNMNLYKIIIASFRGPVALSTTASSFMMIGSGKNHPFHQ